ncbi:MAG TPA: hypothetical protein VIF64_17575 [Pyrinomonadaceae bacterium]
MCKPALRAFTYNQQKGTTAIFSRAKLAVLWNEPVYGKVGASKSPLILGPHWFVQVTAVRVPGKVVWCNFELARVLGFDVPASNQMTPELHEQLVDALSYRVLSPGQNGSKGKAITIYADKYGGEGVAPALGAGRAGFLQYGNLYAKGIGHTPLFKHNDPTDFSCSHGGLLTSEAMVEALFGEVNTNLFTKGSTQILAIVDQDEYLEYPDYRQKSRAIAIRTGMQLRPAHLLATHSPNSRPLLEPFLNMTAETGQLSTHTIESSMEEVPDIRATMLRIIDDHALTAAEQFRWRIIHGALTSSNMELSGAMLDLLTESSQPRTAPLWMFECPDSVFGREHLERAVQLRAVYRKLLRSIPQQERQILNAGPINFREEMERAYKWHLQIKLMCAAGLKTELAERIRADHPVLSTRFMDVIVKLVQVKNPGSLNIRGPSFERISVLDVFHLLQQYPQGFFNAVKADNSRYIRAALRPTFRGNHYQIARNRARVKVLIKEFTEIYLRLMETCASYAAEYYDDLLSMRASIISRAAFENQPLASLYYRKLHPELGQVVEAYKAGGNAGLLREAIDTRVAASLRNVDALLAQGTWRKFEDGGFELERRTIEGINYCIRAWNDETQIRRLHMRVLLGKHGHRYSTGFVDRALTKREILSLRFRFTTDSWKNSAEVRSRLRYDEEWGLVADFEDICILPRIGRLEGLLLIKGPRGEVCICETSRHGGYTFALPDKRELFKIVGRGTEMLVTRS